MARDLTASVVTGLQDRVVRPVLIGRLDIATDPVTSWTGPGTFAPSGSGDPALDGQIFTGIAPFMKLTDITEDQGIGGPVTITLPAHSLDETLLRQIVNDKRQWRGQKAYLWLGLLTPDQSSVISDPFRIKTGVMVNMFTTRKEGESFISVVIDRDLGNARSAAFRWLDHPRFHSTDTWSTYMVGLANKPQGIERTNYTDPYDGLSDGHFGERED
ncbi:MAG: hypothetical protein COA78_37045 [Blastopirellula sp.]|nr:MAG: hypothetical protein COA78_37045 [Blastopirellula sp.]